LLHAKNILHTTPSGQKPPNPLLTSSYPASTSTLSASNTSGSALQEAQLQAYQMVLVESMKGFG
jgi:hypothetical protein